MTHRYIVADARRLPLADASVQLCVTSPPYYNLRHYTDSPLEIGRSANGGLWAYINGLAACFDEVRRVLRPDGTLVLNLGDTYADKALMGVPWQVAFAMRNRGWILRSDSIWFKPNGMPDTAQDRPECMHEHLFVFTKGPRNYWDKYAVARPDRLSVRSCPVGRSKCKHFASYPPGLVLPYVKMATSESGCCRACGKPWRRMTKKTRTPTRPGRTNTVDPTGMAKRDRRRHVTTVETLGWRRDCKCDCGYVPCTVLDPFAGTCSTAVACEWAGRDSIMCDLGPEYLDMGRARVAKERPPKAPKPPVPTRHNRVPLATQMELPIFSGRA